MTTMSASPALNGGTNSAACEASGLLAKVKWPAVAAVLILYLTSISPYWYPTPDSALYLTLTDNLLQGKGYTLWGHPHTHVPPGFPVLGATMKWIGLGSTWWLNFGMIAVALLTLWICYKVLLGQTTAGLALLVTVTVAVSRAMHFSSVRLLSDVPFMLFVWAGIWCYARGLRGRGRWLEMGTLLLIASCWIRVVGIPLAIAAAIGLALEARQARRRRVWLSAALLAAGVALTAAAFYIYYRSVSPTHQLPSYADAVARMGKRSPLEWLGKPVENFLLTARALAELLTGQRHHVMGHMIALLWGPALLGAWVHLRRREYLGVCIVVGYLGAILVYRPMIVRYLLPVAPLLVLYFCEGLWWLVERVPRLRASGPRVAAGCLVVLIACHIPKTCRFPRKLHRADYAAYYRAHWGAMQHAADFLRRNTEPGKRFMSSNDERALAYLSQVPSIPLGRRRTQSRPYQPEDFDRWVERGVEFVVIVRGKSRPRYQRVFTTEFLQQRSFQFVFRSEQFEIYRLRPFRRVTQTG